MAIFDGWDELADAEAVLETTVHAFAVSDRARVRDETERRIEIEGRGLQRIEEFSRDVRDRKSPF